MALSPCVRTLGWFPILCSSFEDRLFLRPGTCRQLETHSHPPAGVVEIAHSGAGRNDLVERRSVLRIELHIEHGDGIVEMRFRARTDDRRGDARLILDPQQGVLGGSDASLFGESGLSWTAVLAGRGLLCPGGN